MAVIHRSLGVALVACLIAAPAAAQTTQDRVRTVCLEQAEAATCDAALGLLWPILVGLSAERGDVLLRQPGQGVMTTASFQNTSPTLEVEWTMDSIESAGCGVALQLVPLAADVPTLDILTTDIPAGEHTSGTGWLYQVPLDQYAVHQSGPGSCPWTVTITAR